MSDAYFDPPQTKAFAVWSQYYGLKSEMYGLNIYRHLRKIRILEN